MNDHCWSLVFVAAVFCSAAANGDEPTGNDDRSARTSAATTGQDENGAPAEGALSKVSIDDFRWIAGHWQGNALGGEFEETWNPPLAGSMVGMFKLTGGDEVRFYELMTIVPHEESFVLRLKHFGSDLAGWEEKDESVEFPLITIEDGKALFNGLRFERINRNEMLIAVDVDDNGETRELKFECRRAPRQSAGAADAQDSVRHAIQQVLEIDRVLAKQRDHLPETQTLAIAVRSYVLGLDSIDYSRCPGEFTAAFRKHRNAWNNSIPFFESHDDLHGEMHDLFDRIRRMDKPVGSELEQHFTAIMETWRPVEALAKKHGVPE